MSFLYKFCHVILVQVLSCHFCTSFVMSFLYKLWHVSLVQLVSCHSCTTCVMSFLYKFCHVILVQVVACQSCATCVMSFLYNLCHVILVQVLSCIAAALYRLYYCIVSSYPNTLVQIVVHHLCTCHLLIHVHVMTYFIHVRVIVSFLYKLYLINHVSSSPSIERLGPLPPVPASREEGKTKGTQASRGSSCPLRNSPSLVWVLCQLVQRCL